MPLPFILAAVFGNAAAVTVVKAAAGKVSAAGLKAIVGHHGHHTLARRVVEKAAEQVADSSIRAAFAKDRQKDEKRE